MIPLFAQSIPLPPETPIPCLVCRAETAATQTFAGTVQLVAPGRMDVFSGKSHMTMAFAVPPDFHAVESTDGIIKGASVARATPGLLVRITYRTVGGRNQITRIELLTINQCRSLEAAERLSDTRTDCPD